MAYKYEFTISTVNPSLISPTFYSQDISFIQDMGDGPPYYTFSSEHLNELTNPIEIWARGKFLLALFRGAYTASYEPFEDFYMANNLELKRLFEGDSDITPSESYNILPQKGFNLLLDHLPSHLQDIADSNRVSKLIALSKNNDDVQNLLLQIGHGIEWINLHSILDSVEYYSKRAQKWLDILTDSGYDQNKVKAFTGTVNNFGLLSTEARHGELGFGAPRNTMNISESRTMILNICYSYFTVIHGIS